MSFRFPPLPWKMITGTVAAILILALAVTAPRWWPNFSDWVDRTLANYDGSPGEEAEHAEHEDHEDGVESLVLSSTAQRNLGLTEEFLQPIALQPYYQSLTVPAVITGRPGRTQLHVSTPMTGIITHVHAVTGQTVLPGELLFEIRLTHEELVDAQTRFLETLEELDVENAEIAWLEGANTLEGRLLRDRQYSRDQLQARQLAIREALKLHGLSERQVDWIADERRLLDTLQVVAPSIDTHPHDEELRLSDMGVVPVSYNADDEGPASDHSHDAHEEGDADATAPLLIEALNVHKGEAVLAGAELCVLGDYRQLFIEGQAFEHDTAAVLAAVEHDWEFSAVFAGPSAGGKPSAVDLAYVSNVIDPVTRVLPFFLKLHNEIVVDETNADEQRFITWRYRPGQRMRVRVPLIEMENQIVLPVEAVAQEGIDHFVFRQNGRRFDRIPVHVVHRDNENVVIAQDGSIFPGDVIARKAAHEMQMAIQNKSGGAVDPHAGHSHG